MSTRDERLEWQKRPCQKAWSVRRRPCPWYKAGEGCRLTWGELVSPYNYVVIAAAWVNVTVAGALIFHSAVQKNIFSRKELNSPYQRFVYVIMLGFVALGIASTDVTGGNKFVSRGARHGFQVTIRVLVEIALFEVGDAYDRALKSLLVNQGRVVVETRYATSKVAVRASLAALYSIVVGTWEVIGVPKRGRAGCSLALPNTLRNLGTATIDTVFFLWTYMHAVAARKSITANIEYQPTPSLRADRRFVEILTTHIAALCFCLAFVFGFATYVGYRNYATGRFLCDQPACSRSAYPWGFVWAIFYHAAVWILVLALVPNRLATRFLDCLATCVPDRGPDTPFTLEKRKQNVHFDNDATNVDPLDTPTGAGGRASSSSGGSTVEPDLLISSPRTRARVFLLEGDSRLSKISAAPTRGPSSARAGGPPCRTALDALLHV